MQREIRDLEVFGGVGEHQLNWTRYGHSRLADGARWFGDGHIWRHSYQYEMVTVSYNLQFTYPDGTVHFYTPNNGWVGASDNPDLLTQSGSDFFLRRADGFTYHFVQSSSGNGQVSYQFQSFTDSFGNPYSLTYDANNRLALVSEPAGRWLRVTYQDVPVNQDQFTTLYAQSSTPTAGWTEVTVNNPTAFRYFRYFSTEAGAAPSYCNVAEVEFYDTAGNKLTGTPFGSTPAYNNGSSTFDKVFDGNTSTFFDFQSPHFGFTGIDLGSGNAKVVGKLRFFPRTGYEARMNGTNYENHPPGCRFESSNVAPVTETVIAKVEAGYSSGGNQIITRTVQYNYATLADPVLTDSSWLTLSAATYGDGAAAAYTYQCVFAGQRPLLASADDPRMQGAATKIKYEFWQGQGNVLGSIYAEHDFTSNQILAKFEGDGTTAGRKITYANGAVRNVQIGDNGCPIARTDALGNKTNLAYAANGGGFLASITDPLNNTTSYIRDVQSRILSATYADQSTEQWTYDAAGHVLTSTDASSHTTTYTRDTNGRPTRIDYADGAYETFTYNRFGQTLTHRRTSGGTESSAYDLRGLKTSSTDVLLQATTYAYDGNDLLVSATDPLNHVTTFTYNERGQVTQVMYADNTAKTYAYDVYSNRISTTNELGRTWTANFDAYKRKITETDPLNRTTQYWYDEPGQGGGGCGGCGSGLAGTGGHLTTIIRPSGKTTKISYDLAWRKIAVTAGYNTSAAATTQYSYNSASDLVGTTDPRGNVTTRVYDNRHRLVSSTDPLNQATKWTYDARGNIATEQRADNGTTTYAYDPLCRRIKTTNPKGDVKQWTYDPSGNVRMIIDSLQKVYTFTYDLRDQKTQLMYPDSSHEDWSYNAVGKILNYTNRAGQSKTTAYDSRNREVNSAWSNGIAPEVTTDYDAAGRVLTLNNANSGITYAYDDAGELTSETQNVVGGPRSQILTNTYDVDGNRSSLTNPDGTTVSYAYTTRNQLASVSLSGPPPMVTYSYDLAGNRIGKVLENGATAASGYDAANKLTSLVYQNHGATFASFSYAYNNVDNRTSVTRETGLSDLYTYDAIDEITGVQYGVANSASTLASPHSTQAYAYDVSGNRTTLTQDGVDTSYQVNNLNEYTQIDGIAQVYDNNGNLTTSNNFTLSYDGQNRLTGLSSIHNNLVNIAYDARNRPVKRTISGTSTYLFYDDWNLVAELSDDGSKLASYVHGAEVDEILVQTNGAGTSYYHHDALGSTMCLTGVSGQVIEQYNYDVFGRTTIKDASGAIIPNSAYGNRFLFTGREMLHGTTLYDYRNRVYSSANGSFVQSDPMRFQPGDFNLYRYVTNDPTVKKDPTGLTEDRGNPPTCPGNAKPVWLTCDTSSPGKHLAVYCPPGAPAPANDEGAKTMDEYCKCHGKTLGPPPFPRGNTVCIAGTNGPQSRKIDDCGCGQKDANKPNPDNWMDYQPDSRNCSGFQDGWRCVSDGPCPSK